MKTIKLISFLMILSFLSSEAWAAWGYVKKDYYCRSSHGMEKLDTMVNSFTGFQFDTASSKEEIEFYSRISRDVVTPYFKSLCGDVKMEFAGQMLVKAKEFCDESCEKGRGSLRLVNSCKKFCERGYKEGALMMEAYAWALQDLTGSAMSTSCK